MYGSAQAVFMFSQVNHNMMGETTGLQFIIAPVKIIYHLSTTPTRELRIFTVFVIVSEEKPYKIYKYLCYVQVCLDIVCLLSISFVCYIC